MHSVHDGAKCSPQFTPDFSVVSPIPGCGDGCVGGGVGHGGGGGYCLTVVSSIPGGGGVGSDGCGSLTVVPPMSGGGGDGIGDVRGGDSITTSKKS